MNQQSTLEQLQELKLSGMAKRYDAIMQQPIHQQPEPHALIAMLTEAEASYRVYQRTELYLRLAKLRYQATTEQINCTPGRGWIIQAGYHGCQVGQDNRRRIKVISASPDNNRPGSFICGRHKPVFNL